MKKIVLLSGIIVIALVSCSPEDTPTYDQNTNKTIITKETPADFCITCRDTIQKDENDSIDVSEPFKPKKD